MGVTTCRRRRLLVAAARVQPRRQQRPIQAGRGTRPREDVLGDPRRAGEMIVPFRSTLPELRVLEERLEGARPELRLEDEDGLGRREEDLVAVEAEQLRVERRAGC